MAALAPVAHLTGFAVLILPIAVLRPGWVRVALPLLFIFGVSIEALQLRTGRDGSVEDAIMNGAGLVLGGLTGTLWRRLAPRPS
jgi:VanZ family protein